MIAIVNYGLGNLRSVAGAVERLGFDPIITDDPELLARSAKLILPGVGAFGDGMRNINESGLRPVLDRLVLGERKPVLGICLGFQLMARQSDEFSLHEGLGWLDASVELMEFARPLRLPHVGWSDLYQTVSDPLFEGIPADALFYYVHSYHVRCADLGIVIGEGDYGGRFTSVIRHGNIYGTQFHPEKSQQWGLTLLQNFLCKG